MTGIGNNEILAFPEDRGNLFEFEDTEIRNFMVCKHFKEKNNVRVPSDLFLEKLRTEYQQC